MSGCARDARSRQASGPHYARLGDVSKICNPSGTRVPLQRRAVARANSAFNCSKAYMICSHFPLPQLPNSIADWPQPSAVAARFGSGTHISRYEFEGRKVRLRWFTLTRLGLVARERGCQQWRARLFERSGNDCQIDPLTGVEHFELLVLRTLAPERGSWNAARRSGRAGIRGHRVRCGARQEVRDQWLQKHRETCGAILAAPRFTTSVSTPGWRRSSVEDAHESHSPRPWPSRMAEHNCQVPPAPPRKAPGIGRRLGR